MRTQSPDTSRSRLEQYAVQGIVAGETAKLVGQLEAGGAEAIVAGGAGQTPEDLNQLGNLAAFDAGTD